MCITEHVVQSRLYNPRCAIYAKQSTSCNHVYMVQLFSYHNKLSTSLLAQTSYPPIRNLVCNTHAVAIAMSTWSWLVHLCGRASPCMLARAAVI
eukprot:2870076-Pyramimonas_sp.AAC.1